MALAALIAAYHESDEPGGALRAILPLAGRTLIERQVRLAAGAGATQILVLVERLPPELVAAIDRLRGDGIKVAIARNTAEAAEAVDPSERLLLVADGFIGDESHLARVIAAGVPALLTMSDAGADDRFERIDSESRWAGLALIDGGMLRQTAAMLRDWDPQSTLLRRAVQASARQLALRGEPADGQLIIVECAADLTAVQQRIVERAATGRGEWVSRYLLASLERAATRLLMPGKVTPQILGIATVFLTALGAVAFARGILWLGLTALLLATPLDGISDRLSRLRMQEGRGNSWWCHIVLVSAGAALIALGYALARPYGWGCVILALTTIAFLLAQRFETEGRNVKGQIFLAERKGMTWLMLPFAATGFWVAGLAMLFVYAAGSFFWAQRRVHSALVPPQQD